MDAARAGCAFLCARTAGVKLFRCRRRLRCDCCWSWCAGSRTGINRSLDDEWWRCAAAASAEQECAEKEDKNRDGRAEPVRLGKRAPALVAESPAGPNEPAQPHDLVATLATEIWTITR